MTAALIEYTEIPQMPGERFFNCERLSAMLRPAACAQRHRDALSSANGLHSACRRCPIGVAHAENSSSKVPVSMMPHTACARCGARSQRLVNKRLCVSCYNREREARVGRNARGKSPICFQPVHRRDVMLRAPDGSRVTFAYVVQNGHEPLVNAVRENRNHELIDQHPHTVAYSALHGFHYVDDDGAPLKSFTNQHGGVEFVPAEADEKPDPVRQPAALSDVHSLAAWLTVTGEVADLHSDWMWQPFGCATCRRGVLRARVRNGALETERPVCKAQA